MHGRIGLNMIEFSIAEWLRLRFPSERLGKCLSDDLLDLFQRPLEEKRLGDFDRERRGKLREEPALGA